jgi:hypothetical protein
MQRVPDLELSKATKNRGFDQTPEVLQTVLREGVEAIALSADGQMLACAHGESRKTHSSEYVRLFDLNRPGTAPRVFAFPAGSFGLTPPTFRSFALLFARDDSILIFGGSAGLYLIDLINPERAPVKIDFDHAPVMGAAFRPSTDGAIELLVGCTDGSLHHCEITPTGVIATQVAGGHGRWIGLTHDAESNKAMACTESGVVVQYSWDQKGLTRFPTGVSDVTAFAPMSDQKSFALGTKHGIVEVRKLDAPTHAMHSHQFTQSIRSLVYSPRDRRIIAATGLSLTFKDLASIDESALPQLKGELWSLASDPQATSQRDLITSQNHSYSALATTPERDFIAAATSDNRLTFHSSTLEHAARALANSLHRTLSDSEWLLLIGDKVPQSLKRTPAHLNRRSR